MITLVLFMTILWRHYQKDQCKYHPTQYSRNLILTMFKMKPSENLLLSLIIPYFHCLVHSTRLLDQLLPPFRGLANPTPLFLLLLPYFLILFTLLQLPFPILLFLSLSFLSLPFLLSTLLFRLTFRYLIEQFILLVLRLPSLFISLLPDSLSQTLPLLFLSHHIFL